MKFKIKLNIKSISVKISLLYGFLAVFNMSFFSIMIYENQIDLVIENTKFHAKDVTDNLISSIKKFSSDMTKSQIFDVKDKKEIISEITEIIEKIIGKRVNDFVIFTEEGKTLYQTDPSIKVTKDDVTKSIKAITNMDFTGKEYFSNIDEETNLISFYIPFKIFLLDDSILFLKFKMQDIGNRIESLYKMVITIVVFIALFHVIFAIILFRMFILPIKSLHSSSLEISAGNLAARSEIKQTDEIGELGKAFNDMADTIQEKITTLQKQRDQIEFELDVAGGVQRIIFPDFEANDRFHFSVFHRAYGKVSGDYYDIFNLPNSRYGFLLIDVSGHGVPAALITMIAKDLFRLNAPVYDTPSELLKRVNSELVQILGTYDLYISLYFSAFYFVIDEKNLLHFCNGGHHEALLVRKKKRKLTKLDSNGFLVGISEDMNEMYETRSTYVEPGDKIVVFTDGIIEAKGKEDNEQYGHDRLITSIQRRYSLNGDEILEGIMEDFTNYANLEDLDDDATLFVIEVK